MTLLFDAEPMSRYANAYCDTDYWNRYWLMRGNQSAVTVIVDANNDYSTSLNGQTRIIASGRNAVHGQTDGDWYYLSLNNLWIADPDNSNATASSLGLDEQIKSYLLWASRELDGLEFCGSPAPDRTKTFSGELTLVNATQTIESAAANEAFKWLEAGDTISISNASQGYGLPLNVTVSSINVSADPHFIFVSSDELSIVDEVVSNAELSFTYSQSLQFPKPDVLDAGMRELPDKIIPRQLKDAVCETAFFLMSGGGAAGYKVDNKPEDLKRVEVFEAVEVEFQDSDKVERMKRYIPDTALSIISAMLCERIGAYGNSAPCSGIAVRV